LANTFFEAKFEEKTPIYQLQRPLCLLPYIICSSTPVFVLFPIPASIFSISAPD
jgi:hypothetical protein